MTTELAPPARTMPRSLPIIAAVAVAAITVGGVAGAFLLGDRTAGAGSAAGYVSADVPFYLELRLDPSDAQDAALRELLGHFPPIEGIDLDRPLFDQLGEAVDEAAASADETDLRWADDVATWFDGHVTLAVTDVPLEPAADGSEPMPELLVVLGSTDADAARAATERMRAEAGTDVQFTETEHRGVTITTTGDEQGAYAITDDAVLLAPTAAEIEAALDIEADAAESLGDGERLADAAGELPDDWLAFAVYDVGELVSASLDAGDAPDVSTEPLRALLAQQPMRGAMAVTADGDRLALTSVSDVPTGDFTMENADRGLADEVPADALYYADGGNIGPSLAAFITALKESVAGQPEAADQIATAEAALGADLEELVSWVDDAALVIGMDGDTPYGGAVLVPSDADAAQRRIGQLVTFARLGAMDSSSGITVDERDVDGTIVTSITWRPASFGADGMMAGPDGATIEVATTDDRAYLAVGEGSVERLLTVDAGDSLATVDRFTDAVDQLGGSDNVGTVWLDLRGVRNAIESALGPMLDEMDPDGAYQREVLPWLEPLDRMVGVTRVEGDRAVQRSVLLVD